MVVIINYGIGNLASVQNMLKKASVDSIVSSDKNVIASASKLILPGIGHFDYCMKEFRASGLQEIIEKKVLEDKMPVLGICVGCQMLVEKSEEGMERGLGWLKGEVIRFRKEKLPSEYKIPHMSWTDVQPLNGALLYKDIHEPRFYFVHSYHIETPDKETITGVAEYGYPFTASVGKDNIQGVQFHPEKSHKYGLQLYKNFANYF